MAPGFTIGELARRTSVSRDTVRFYERERLLPPPRRTTSGYRLYGSEDISRVAFIRHAQAIGLSLDDIRELLRIRQLDTPEECRRVAERLRARMQALEQKMAQLEAFRDGLSDALARCEGAGASSCPIVLDLADTAPVPHCSQGG